MSEPISIEAFLGETQQSRKTMAIVGVMLAALTAFTGGTAVFLGVNGSDYTVALIVVAVVLALIVVFCGYEYRRNRRLEHRLLADIAEIRARREESERG